MAKVDGRSKRWTTMLNGMQTVRLTIDRWRIVSGNVGRHRGFLGVRLGQFILAVFKY